MPGTFAYLFDYSSTFFSLSPLFFFKATSEVDFNQIFLVK
jgi:hypothetical protein